MGSSRAVLLISLARLCQSALAQGSKPLEWQSADGFVHFTVPAGWYRQDLAPPSSDPNVVLEVSKSDPGMDQPSARCKVRTQALAAGLTQEEMNRRVHEGVQGPLKLIAPRVRTVDGVAVVDAVADTPTREDVQMLFSVVRHGKGNMFSLRCRRIVGGAIRPADLATMRIFFDTLRISD